ncbi:MAG: carboxypeptidase regulatory-like domain-containing protein, partial [Acidobacteriaceae bacterium]|nr:carboxypeptidase regulatory-like domain-containing protein [Acidobacteriaceae bacterium]
MLRTISIRTALVFTLVALHTLNAQQGRGLIFGTVTDPSGAPIPAAQVQVTNVDTNAITTAVSGAQGDYQTPELPIGHYRVSINQSGFKEVIRTGIVLQVGQRAEVNLQLTVGSVEEKIEVTADAPLVDTSTATVGQAVENKRIEELPLNGRNALALMFLTPDVKSQAGATNSGFADRGTALSSVSINGGPSSVNNFLLDGGNNNQAFVEDLNVNPTVDAIQEFRVQSGVLSAEYGFTLGGVVNIVSKSGTNDIHGTAYEFVRNNDFDARNTFAPGVPPYRYNQYGGAIGGPIWIPKVYNGRNKTFFFFNIEQWQYTLGSNPIVTVPTAAERAGDFSNLRDATGKLIVIYDPQSTRTNPSGSGVIRDPFPNNIIPANRLDPVVQNYYKLVPLPNRTPTNAFTHANNYIADASQHEHMEQYLPKVNHYFSEKNSAFFRFMYFNHFNDNGGNIYTAPILAYRYDNLEARNAVFSDTHTFSPTLFNDFRLDLARNYFPFKNASYGLGIPQQLGLPASVPPYEVPQISAGLPATSDQSVGVRGQTTWQFFDAVTWVRGAHSIKVGVEGRIQNSNNFQPTNLSGNYSFASTLTGNPQSQAGTGSSTATFDLGSVSSATIVTGVGQSAQGYSISGFVQDDWRATRKLTVNIGLRYDSQPWPVERHNGISGFLPSVTNPQNGLKGAMGYAGKDFGQTPYTSSPLAFGP